MKRFDQIVLGSIFLLALLLTLVLGFGDRTPIQVQQFSWEGKRISVQDQSFQFTLSRPLDPNWVAENLVLDPPLPGKLSWVGRKFFYTLTDLPIYGEEYQLKIAAGETSVNPEEKATQQKAPLEPFLTRFRTRDRAFAYIGTEGTNRGRLILSNLTAKETSILTPADLVVLDFAAYPEGDRLLFSAIPRGGVGVTPDDQQLYTVTTGLTSTSPKNDNTERAAIAGKMDLILPADDYRNGTFQLSQNGQRIIVQRTNRDNPKDTGLWVIEGKAEPRGLGIPAENFLLSPDGSEVAITQQNQLSLVPLGRNSGAIQAKEDFSRILAFSPKTQQKIALQETDGIHSLYILNENNEEKVLLRTLTPIVDCRYEPRYQETLYCLKIDQTVSLGQTVEEPFLSTIDLQSGEEIPLLALPNYRDVRLSVAADGLALLFDQVVTAPPTDQTELFTSNGLAVEGGRLWLLALPELKADTEIQPIPPESLMPGFKPLWIP